MIVATYVTGIKNPNSYQDYLNQEAKHVIWRGPFDNTLMSLQNITGMKTDTIESGNVSTSSVTEMVAVLDPIDDKVNLHVWSSYFLLKCIVFIFGWMLVSSAKRVISLIIFKILVYLRFCYKNNN